MRYTDDVPEAEGDWQVDHNLCMACGAPPVRAPDLMGFGNNHANPEYVQCYFKRQPQTKEEHNRAFHAAEASCCGAVRYCGGDPALVRRMQELEASTVGPVPAELLRGGQPYKAHVRRVLLRLLLLYASLAVLWVLWALL